MAKHRITQADIKDWAKNYKGELFDGILCDPPYELGFMGKSWDSSGIAFDVEMWADIFRHIKPGGHLLAFSGSRTYHRMAVAIEDAGFEIRDQLIWMYGSGFPKSLNIGKAVDRLQGNEREDAGEYKRPDGSNARKNVDAKAIWGNADGNDQRLTKGTSEWEGWGTALKPSHEPICMARKPLGEKTVAENCLKYGTGGINIDESRVENTGKSAYQKGGGIVNGGVAGTHEVESEFGGGHDGGRFPANLIHDGSDEVEAVFPNESSRFFYTAKASKSERNAGLEGFENHKPMYESHRPNYENTKGIETPYAGAGRTGNANQNHHPTVKPLSLTKYLATLIKPPTGGRLLVPFSGSGSEMIGALQAGWGYVEGVELTEEYIPIAEARIKYWLEQVEEEDKQGKLL